MILSLLINVSAKTRFNSINHILNKQIEAQIKHYEKQDRLSRDLRRFRHDYTNHLNSILALIDGECYTDAKEYIEKITSAQHSGQKICYTGNRLADIIISDKSDSCREFAKIEFDGYISDKIDNYDMCIILANALDNAVEACEKLGRKSIISIAAQVIQGYFVMTIRNPTSMEDQQGMPKTSKADKQNHGLGLLSIEQSVKKYDGDMDVKAENGVFELSVTLKI